MEKVYFEKLDHLIFFAAFLVPIWHSSHISFDTIPNIPFLSMFEEGHTGIALFMVLSGFLFQIISNNKQIDFKNFLYNRLIRIAPLFLVWVLFNISNKPGIDTVKILVNTLFLMDSKAILSVGWTIITEFQFYLIFPFLHLILEKKNGVFDLLFIISVFFIFRNIAVFKYSSCHFLSYWTFFGRIDHFTIGMILARLGLSFNLQETQITKDILLAIALLSFFLIYSIAIYWLFNLNGGFNKFDGFISKSYVWTFISTIEGLLWGSIIFSYHFMSFGLPRIISKLFSKLGELSYSMYWCHFPIIYALVFFINKYEFQPVNFYETLKLTIILILPVVLFVSLLTFEFIEKPFFAYKRKYLL